MDHGWLVATLSSDTSGWFKGLACQEVGLE